MGTREQNKANRAYYTSRGICGKCGKRPVEPGRLKCFECLDADVNAHKRMMERKSPEERRRIMDQKNAERRNRTAYRQEHGLCTQCGKPVVPGKRLCIDHLAKKRRTKDKRWNNEIPRSERPSYGICWLCGKRPILPEKTLCEQCFRSMSDRAKERAKHLTQAQLEARKKWNESFYRKMNPNWRNYEKKES